MFISRARKKLEMQLLIVTSYWSGELPDITKLHFESFRALNPTTEYVLYLDSDEGFEGVVPPSLSQTLDRLRISTQKISLGELMSSSGIPSFSVWKNSFIYRAIRSFLAKLLSNLSPLILGLVQKTEVRLGNNFFTTSMGFSPGHARAFSGSKVNLAERSDLFRSTIFNQYPDRDFLYIDLDICFIKPLALHEYPLGAISQWGTAEFGNSAFLYLPESARRARKGIANELRLGTSALPWILYNKIRCEYFGLKILSNDMMDPAWSPNSIIHGASDKFFKSGSHVDTFLDEIRSNNLLIHWHNQWNQIPEKGSPFDVLLSKFQS